MFYQRCGVGGTENLVEPLLLLWEVPFFDSGASNPGDQAIFTRLDVAYSVGS